MTNLYNRLTAAVSLLLLLQIVNAFQTSHSNSSFAKRYHSVLNHKNEKKSFTHLFRHPTILCDTKKDDPMDYIQSKLKNVNQLEIRLDATLASCYNLCRFLLFDVTTGAKDVPGWQISDLIMLGGAFSSCVVLSLIWSIIGIYTGIFEDTDNDELWNVASTAAIVGPLWLIVEIIAGWPPSGVLLANDLNGLNTSEALNAIATSSLGLASIMCIGKVLTAGWR